MRSFTHHVGAGKGSQIRVNSEPNPKLPTILTTAHNTRTERMIWQTKYKVKAVIKPPCGTLEILANELVGVFYKKVEKVCSYNDKKR